MNQQLEETAPPADLNYVKFKVIEKAQKTFFYQKKDQFGNVIEDSPIFACYEQEAALNGKKYKLIGVSDGKTYVKYLRECGVKQGEIIDILRAKEILQGAFDAELEAARGKFSLPVYQGGTIDPAISRDQLSEFNIR